MKELVKKILKKAGVQLKRYPDNDLARRMKLVNTYKIDTIFDIGANAGQFGSNMRELGYTGKILSFEPMAKAFGQLKQASKNDANWTAFHYAMGDEDGKTSIHVAGNSYSSSILNMMPQHEESAPESKYIATEEIEIKKLDSVFPQLCPNGEAVMVKIDTQGFEKNVLDGASQALKKIALVQLEMSLIPLYENEMLFQDMVAYLTDKGFRLISLENGFADAITGQLLQVDGIFVRQDLAKS